MSEEKTCGNCGTPKNNLELDVCNRCHDKNNWSEKPEPEKKDVCVWEQQPHRWIASCGLVPRGTFLIADFKYCYNCGKRIEVKE